MLVRRAQVAMMVLAAAISMAAAPASHAVAHSAGLSATQGHHDDDIISGSDEHEHHGHVTPALPRLDDGPRHHAILPDQLHVLHSAPRLGAASAALLGMPARDAARAPPSDRAPPEA